MKCTSSMNFDIMYSVHDRKVATFLCPCTGQHRKFSGAGPVRPLVWLQEGNLLHILFGHQAGLVVQQGSGPKKHSQLFFGIASG